MSMRLCGVILVVGVLIVSTGCISAEEFEAVKQKTAANQSQLAALAGVQSKTAEGHENRLAKVEAGLQKQGTDIAKLDQQIRGLQSQMAKLRQLTNRVTALEHTANQAFSAIRESLDIQCKVVKDQLMKLQILRDKLTSRAPVVPTPKKAPAKPAGSTTK